MNIDMDLALTIAAGILIAGVVKQIIVIGTNQVFGYGGTHKYHK